MSSFEPSSAIAAATTTTFAVEQHQPARTKMTILIVDDEPAVRALLAKLLSQDGYQVVEASGGAEAISIAVQQDVHLMLLDIQMPEMDGFQTLKLLRGVRSAIDLPVVMVTASEKPDHIVEAFAQGANDYISKPIDRRLTLARIAAQLKLKETQDALRESEERYALAARGSNDGLWDWNIRNGHVYYSPRWKAMLGRSDAEVGTEIDDWLRLIHDEDRARVQTDLRCHLDGESAHFETELRMMHQSGTYHWMLCRGLAVRDQQGQACRIAGSLTDITEGKVADGLTGLPNRLLFIDRIQRCIEQQKRNASRLFAVLYIDVDDFKLINDSYGHDAGDRFLVAMAQRLEGSLRKNDSVVARLGGDEFAILLENVRDEKEVEMASKRILERMSAPFDIADRELFVRASVGITVASSRCDTAEALLREADTAMYYAKQKRHLPFKLFKPELNEETAARLELGSELRRAVERDELMLQYQPIVDLETSRTAGFEALVRWNRPDVGLMPPAEFIDLAEDMGLIVPMGQWVLIEATRKLAQWNRTTLHPIQISVNVSSRQLASEQFSDVVRDAIEVSGIQADHLKLEVTESTIMQRPEESTRLLESLRNMGVTIGVDDFGTGYSSLSYLHHLPLDVLKIDRSFVDAMFDSPRNMAIIKTIVALADSTNLDVVAEGIETRQQLDTLIELGCRYGQGYLFSRPVSEEDALVMVERSWDVVTVD